MHGLITITETSGAKWHLVVTKLIIHLSIIIVEVTSS
jgi:hypothetical protein